MNDYPMTTLPLTVAAAPSSVETTITCRWYALPTSRREWTELEALLADKTRGWSTTAEIKHHALELSYDAAVMGPTVRGLSSDPLMGPTMERERVLRVAVLGGLGCDHRSRRRDQGTRRPSLAQGPSTRSTVGPISGRDLDLLTVGPISNGEPALLPSGLAAALPTYGLAAYRACALDVLNRLAERPDEYHSFNSDTSKVRYGHPRLADGRRPWVWSQVQLDLLRGGFIEAWSTATSDASYVPGRCSKAFRLVRRWREVDGLEVVARSVEEVLPDSVAPVPTREDGTAVEVPSWLERCVRTVDFDLLGALRAIFQRYGVTEPASLDLPSVLAAISTATTPDALLAEIDEDREDGDKRTPQVIARAQASARVRHLWAWRTLGRSQCHRDPAGHRLHTPITRLASELRPFLSFAGEPLVSIDAKNSQMTLIARAALKASKGAASAVDFADVCAAGRFYEESFFAVHGRYPTLEERARWKRRVMAIWLYATTGCMSHDHDALALAKRWPSVHAFMFHQKRCGVRDLPCRMQREESAIWIDQLGPELKRLGVPALTCHDSVLVPASREAEVRAVLERLYEVAGVRAKFA